MEKVVHGHLLFSLFRNYYKIYKYISVRWLSREFSFTFDILFVKIVVYTFRRDYISL